MAPDWRADVGAFAVGEARVEAERGALGALGHVERARAVDRVDRGVEQLEIRVLRALATAAPRSGGPANGSGCDELGELDRVFDQARRARSRSGRWCT